MHYKGNAPAMNDLLGGQVQFSFDQVSVAQPFVKEGRLRALAVVAPKRVPWLPDVPTLEEQGIKGVEGQTFTGLLAPASTPKPVIDKLSAAMKQVLEDPAVVKKFYAAGAEAHWSVAAGLHRLPPEGGIDVAADHQGGQHQGAVRRS